MHCDIAFSISEISERAMVIYEVRLVLIGTACLMSSFSCFSIDPLYISFHDEEWGVPVHDDWRLFELLVFSQALAELSWPTIVAKRDIFR